MSDMKDRVASFHEEVMHDADFTLSEAIAEAKRCLNCQSSSVPQGLYRLKMKFRNSSMP